MNDASPPNKTTEQAFSGEVVNWNDNKGFGFIRVNNQKNNFFFHISSFAYHHRRPQKNDKVTFSAYLSKQKWQVTRVVLSEHSQALYGKAIQDNQMVKPLVMEAVVYSMIVVFFYMVLLFISIPLAVSSMLISVLTAFLYFIDKRASIKQKQRIPEASMHLSAMLGGWPGALIARPLLRHKTKKIRFIIFFWLSIIIYFFTLYCIIIYAPQYLGFEMKFNDNIFH